MILPSGAGGFAERRHAQGFVRPADNRRMEAHYHAWIRSGRVFTMVARPYAVPSTAHRYAEKLRPDKADRLVLACEACPPSRRSRRRVPSMARVAAAVAEAVGADPAVVRVALDEAMAVEKRNRVG